MLINLIITLNVSRLFCYLHCYYLFCQYLGGWGGGGGAGLQASVHLNLYCQDMYVYA